MVYYLELDPSKKILEVHECKNIHQAALATDISWLDVNNYLNGTDKPVVWLTCGIQMPFIKKSGKMFIISYFKEIIDDRNYPWMSNKVLEELKYMDQYEDVTATGNVNKKVSNKCEYNGK